MFVNLHLHSCYSLLDSIAKIDDVVNKVKELKQPAVAITDHGNVFATVKAFKKCKKENIKFIYGCEMYICDDMTIKDKSNKYYHLVILAKNEQGRLNLNKLLSKSHLEGFYYKPRIDFELLKQYKEGLIILSACMAGEIQRNLYNNNYQNAKEIALKYKNEFQDDYYLEFQSHNDKEQLELAKKVVSLSKELNIPYVVTSDAHYVNNQDKELHSIFVQIGQEREVGESYNDCYIQNENDVENILKNTLTKDEINIAINNTIKIANKCNVNIPLSPPLIPHVDFPQEFKSEEQYLKHLCAIGWKQRNIHELPKEKQKEYEDRLKYEIHAISEMGFVGYYLLVYSYANVARRRGVARGSGGGSLVAYLLNIVDIDPIEYGLYFERFIDVSALDLLKEGKINPEELKIPDFDLDFGELDREEVLQFITNKYGIDKVASIGNFQYIWDKSAIKDVGRVLNISFAVTNEITNQLKDMTIDEALSSGIFSKYEKEYPTLFHYAKQLAGLPRSFGMHPCGKIVSIKDLDYYTAIASNNENIVYQADMDDIEDLGLVKIDTLGLRTVDVIYNVLDMIGKDYNYIAPKNINFNDKKVLEVFKHGNTHGIFQFESDGMKATLKQIQPNSLNDLAVANALYRPGAKDYISNFAKRKHGQEEFDFLHKDLEGILNTTYGIMVFQEQLIEIGRLAGMRNPDELRKATGKKKPALMAKVEPELKEGLKKRGWTQEQVNKLWEDMLKFANYSFNKSHSYAYSIMACIVAMLKVYHPLEFMCALINSYHGKHDKMQGCYLEAKRLNVEIEFPKLKNTSNVCRIENNKLIYGISLIKHCNKKNADELFELSKSNYNSFLDLLIDIKDKTSVNSRQLDILIKLDFFNEFGSNKKLLNYIELFNQFYGKKQLKKDKVDYHNILVNYARETEKSFMDFQSYDFLDYMWSTLKEEKLSPYEQIISEIEYLGYAISTYPQDKKAVMVMEIDTKYTPKLQIYALATGKTETVKISKNEFNYKNIKVGSVLKINKLITKPKNRKVDGKWEQIQGTKEYWIKSYTIL